MKGPYKYLCILKNIISKVLDIYDINTKRVALFCSNNAIKMTAIY